MASWNEITIVVEGAVDETITLVDADPDQVAYEAAQKLRETAELVGISDWQVFIMPHECEPDDEECVCAQYLQDHRPDYSSRTARLDRQR